MNIIRNMALGYYRTKYAGEYSNMVRSLHPLRLDLGGTRKDCLSLFIQGRQTTSHVTAYPGGALNITGSVWRAPERPHEGYWI